MQTEHLHVLGTHRLLRELHWLLVMSLVCVFLSILFCLIKLSVTGRTDHNFVVKILLQRFT